MALVTGNFGTFGLESLSLIAPQVVFTPSGPAYTGSTYLLASKPVVVTTATDGSGAFTVQLSPTSALNPVSWYTISFRWLDSGGNYIGVDFPDWKLFVPPAGGNIADLIVSPWNPTLAWWSPDTPPGPPVYSNLWLDPDTAILKIWS